MGHDGAGIHVGAGIHDGAGITVSSMDVAKVRSRLEASPRLVETKRAIWGAAFGLPGGVTKLSMVPGRCLVVLGHQVDELLKAGVDGAFVECGVWRGGAAFVIADRLRRAKSDRLVWMVDSFEGLPAPTKADGSAALAYAKDTANPAYYDNCSASIEEVEASAKRLKLTDQVKLVKGWFDDTLPDTREKIGPIAMLRIDADWYQSVRCCLDQLYEQVSPGGLVILDDYYTWDGCTLAVHDFLSERQLPLRIRENGCAFFRKDQPSADLRVTEPDRD
jgi:O-methyltransferase